WALATTATVGLIAVLGLVFASPALAKKPLPTRSDNETAEEQRDPPPELSVEDRAELFKPYQEAMQRGQKAQAADALLPILDEYDSGEAHGEAWVKLGDLLTSFDMEYSALVAYSRGIEADPDVGAAKVSLAIELADKLGDNRIIAPILASNMGLKVDKGTRSKMAYLAARHNFQNGDFGMALGMLIMVDKKSESFMEAEALRGVVLSQQGQNNKAMAPLLTAQALGRQKNKGERFDNVLTLNVARTYFAAGNYPRAMEFYGKVDRGSDFWPQAWYEKAWSHFRFDDMSGTLATLMVHDSPFFRDWYLPEADLLRTYALFLMCKFPDATDEIEAFEARYNPLRDELTRTLGSYSPQDGWADGLGAMKRTETTMPKNMLRPFVKDERFVGAVSAVAKADDELERLKNVSANVFAHRATLTLTERKAQIIEEEGQRIVNRAAKARDELKAMLSNVQITKLDMMQYETTMYERAAQVGELEGGDRIGQLRKLRNKSSVRVWPYQGEVWADELGYYRITARPDCPESLRPGAKTR
ncbi:MAG: tetratricopeptide (TPR) repeat protein, partial [Kiritimatiellia bacterium]